MASIQDDTNIAFRQVIVCTEEQYTKGVANQPLKGWFLKLGITLCSDATGGDNHTQKSNQHFC